MASGHGVPKPNRAHDPNRKVDLSKVLGQGKTIPNSDYTSRMRAHGQSEPDYGDTHAQRQERRRPEGDTW